MLRRRVGLRLMIMILRLDPVAYTVGYTSFAFSDSFSDFFCKTYREEFLKVLWESLVSSKITIEHEYASLLFSIDGLRHPLLRGLPCHLGPNDVDLDMTKQTFLNLRLQIFESDFYLFSC
jgi:hypothetical protein